MSKQCVSYQDFSVAENLKTNYKGTDCSNGWDSSVGIATRYGLDGPVIDSRWGRDFPHLSIHTGPGAHPTSYKIGTGSFLVVKRPGRDGDHPPPSTADVRERVELYFYSMVQGFRSICK
jgi:hypothetical protein